MFASRYVEVTTEETKQIPHFMEMKSFAFPNTNDLYAGTKIEILIASP